MKSAKLFQLLHSLATVEQNRFRKYIRSPYFNTDDKLVLLTDLLLEGREETLSREWLDQTLFPGQAFDYFRISNLLSYITRHLSRFLVLEHQQADSFDQQQHFLLSLRERGLEKLFQQESQKLLRKLEQVDPLDEHIFYQQQWLEQERDAFFLRTGKREDDQSLIRQVESLDRFYVLAMLKSMCQLRNRQHILQTTGIPYLQEAFTGYLQRHHAQYEAYPLIQAYYHVLQSLVVVEPDLHYQTLRQLLGEKAAALPNAELQTLYQYARNFCIRQSNQGQIQYLQELFGLYQEMIERDLLYPDGYLSPGDLKNIVSLGIRLGEFAWTEQFLHAQSSHLPPEQRDNALRYNQAQLAYARGKFREAMRLLVAVEFEDVFYYPGAKTLLLKIYYALDEPEALAALLHTFQAWLQRDKLLSPVQREVHLNLIRLVRKLQGLRSQAQASGRSSIQSDLKRLEQSIAGTQGISQQAWLVERLEELKGG